MNALAQIDFSTAYRQLQPAERAFVDYFVDEIETTAARECTRLETILQRPLPENLDGRAVMMLQRALVRAAIAERVRELSENAELSVYKTLKELRSIGYSNIQNYMEIDPNTGEPSFNLSKCTPEQMAAVKTIKIEENPSTGRRKFEFVLHDKQAALMVIAAHQGIGEGGEVWTQKPASVKKLAGDTTVEQAADAYSRLINT